jgi:hypothetical protein
VSRAELAVSPGSYLLDKAKIVKLTPQHLKARKATVGSAAPVSPGAG